MALVGIWLAKCRISLAWVSFGRETWTLCNHSQREQIMQQDYLYAVPNSQSGRSKFEIFGAHNINGCMYYRYSHLSGQHHDILVRGVVHNGRLPLQFEVGEVNNDIKKINVYNMSGTKVFTDTYDAMASLSACFLAHDILQHMVMTNKRFSFNVKIILLEAGENPKQFTGGSMILNPRLERLKRARKGQTTITDFFGK